MTTGYLLRDKEYSKKYFKGILKVYLIAVSIIILSAIYDSISKYTPENVNISMPKLIVKSIISFGYSAWVYIHICRTCTYCTDTTETQIIILKQKMKRKYLY